MGFSADTVKFREVPWPALVLGPVTRSCIKNINTVTAVSWPGPGTWALGSRNLNIYQINLHSAILSPFLYLPLSISQFQNRITKLFTHIMHFYLLWHFYWRIQHCTLHTHYTLVLLATHAGG